MRGAEAVDAVTASYTPGRWRAVCTRCGRQYPSNDGWAWVCYECSHEALLEAIPHVVAGLLSEVSSHVVLELCPRDGCLIRSGESCPACRVEWLQTSKYRRLMEYVETEHDPRRPIRWVRRGAILRAVYDQSEVA